MKLNNLHLGTRPAEAFDDIFNLTTQFSPDGTKIHMWLISLTFVLSQTCSLDSATGTMSMCCSGFRVQNIRGSAQLFALLPCWRSWLTWTTPRTANLKRNVRLCHWYQGSLKLEKMKELKLYLLKCSLNKLVHFRLGLVHP